MSMDLKEIEKFLTVHSGYRKDFAIGMIIKKYKLTECDANKIYRCWRNRFTKPGYNMSVINSKGVRSLSIDERFRIMCEKSTAYNKHIFIYVAQKVYEGVGLVEISKELNIKETQVAGIKLKLREYDIIKN